MTPEKLILYTFLTKLNQQLTERNNGLFDAPLLTAKDISDNDYLREVTLGTRVWVVWRSYACGPLEPQAVAATEAQAVDAALSIIACGYSERVPAHAREELRRLHITARVAPSAAIQSAVTSIRRRELPGLLKEFAEQDPIRRAAHERDHPI